MSLEKKAIAMEVIGKRERTKGLIFRKPQYIVALKVVDRTEKLVTVQRELSYDKYCALNVGDKVRVTMYTQDKKTWFFSPEEADLSKESEAEKYRQELAIK
jgi:hypothetical protein